MWNSYFVEESMHYSNLRTYMYVGSIKVARFVFGLCISIHNMFYFFLSMHPCCGPNVIACTYTAHLLKITFFIAFKLQNHHSYTAAFYHITFCVVPSSHYSWSCDSYHALLFGSWSRRPPTCCYSKTNISYVWYSLLVYIVTFLFNQ